MIWFWILVAVVLAVLIVCFLLAAVVEKIAFGKRCEGNPLLQYFTAADFENLDAEPVEFLGNRGQTLRGNLYKERGKTDYKALLIFAHGMGGGHLSYTTEFNFFAKHGFLVLAYDNTGTMASDGKSLVGMPQAVSDLKCALQFAKTDPRTKDLPILLAGHSWGAYTVCRAADDADVKGVLSFSAPEDVPELLCSEGSAQTGKNLHFLKPFLRAYEWLRFGSAAAKTTSACLLDCTAPVLLLHGEKDTSVPLSSAAASSPVLRGKSNIRIEIFPDKQHNVYASKEAEQYITEAFQELGVLSKTENGAADCAAYAKTLNFHKMCEEDPAVMGTALQFLLDFLN